MSSNDQTYLEETIETYRIHSESDVMSAVIAIFSLVQNRGFSETAVSEISTSVSELAMNIVKYAKEGVITIRSVEEIDQQQGIKVIAKDVGPGIEDISAALEEHYSTGTSLGLGLPGVQRMVDEFDIESELGKGTQVTFIKWKT